MKDTELKKRAAMVGALYRRNCRSLPPLDRGAEFESKALSLLKQGQHYQMVDYYEAFWLAERSEFLKGGGNWRWRANFCWLITPENMQKVLKERYTTPLPALERKGNRTMFRMYLEALEQAKSKTERRGNGAGQLDKSGR